MGFLQDEQPEEGDEKMGRRKTMASGRLSTVHHVQHSPELDTGEERCWRSAQAAQGSREAPNLRGVHVPEAGC